MVIENSTSHVTNSVRWELIGHGKRLETHRTEADRIAGDSHDPVFKMLDDGEMSMQEIFDVMSWESIPAELFEIGDK